MQSMMILPHDPTVERDVIAGAAVEPGLRACRYATAGATSSRDGEARP
jgi:hypothetical protein